MPHVAHSGGRLLDYPIEFSQVHAALYALFAWVAAIALAAVSRCLAAPYVAMADACVQMVSACCLSYSRKKAPRLTAVTSVSSVVCKGQIVCPQSPSLLPLKHTTSHSPPPTISAHKAFSTNTHTHACVCTRRGVCVCERECVCVCVCACACVHTHTRFGTRCGRNYACPLCSIKRLPPFPEEKGTLRTRAHQIAPPPPSTCPARFQDAQNYSLSGPKFQKDSETSSRGLSVQGQKKSKPQYKTSRIAYLSNILTDSLTLFLAFRGPSTERPENSFLDFVFASG